MAEAIAVIGLVASIIQLVSFADGVVRRVNEFRNSAKEVPAVLRDIAITLPLLVSDLKRTKDAAEDGRLDEEEKASVLAVIEGCSVQIQALDEILQKTLVAAGDSKWMASKKALLSFHQEEKLRSASDKLVVSIAQYVEPVKAKPQPISMIPFTRDSVNFVGREALIDTVTARFKQHDRVALVGLGGVGKSQLAVEFSYKLRDVEPNLWIFWVHVSTQSRFKQSFSEIARKAQLPKIEHPESDALQEVTDWLCDESNGRWLLILDNCDDLDVLTTDDIDASGTFTKDSKPLIEYIPQTKNGSILITSRDREVALALTNDNDCLVHVDSMTDKEAVALLRSKLPKDKSPALDAKELVGELAYLPLAIKQAAAYIMNGPTSMTISKYLQYFRKNEEYQRKLLLKDFHDLTRDHDLKNSIILTWQLSFEQISSRNPAAADLLALMSFFDRQSIPKFLLCKEDEELEFEEMIAPLLNFSLVVETADESFTMHRLVQMTTQKWIGTGKRQTEWREQALGIVSEAFPDGDYENWTKCEILYPHAQLLTSSASISDSSLEDLASLLHGVGLYDKEQGRFEAAHRNIEKAYSIRKKVLGEDHTDTSTCLDSLGSVLEKEGRWQEAVIAHREALKFRQKILGADSAKTLDSINNLGLDLVNADKYEEAEKLLRTALERERDVLGPEHPSILRCMHNLGESLANQGKFEESLQLGWDALKIQDRVLGEEHPQTLDSVNNVGAFLSELGRFAEAGDVLDRAFKSQEKILGPEHPATLVTLGNLGFSLLGAGRNKEAEPIFRRQLNLEEKISGMNHPLISLAANNLAVALFCSGKYTDSLSIHERAFNVAANSVGEEHRYAWSAKTGIAACYTELGKIDEAIKLNREVLKARQTHFGPEHTHTTTSIGALAEALRHARQFEEARQLRRKQVEILERTQHGGPLLSLARIGLARLLYNLESYDEAETLLRLVLALQKQDIGDNNDKTAVSYLHLARVLYRKKEYQESEEFAFTANEFLVEEHGWEHADALQSAHIIAKCCLERRNYDLGGMMGRRALSGRRQKFGVKDPRTKSSARILGSILQAQGRVDEAIALKDLAG